MKTCVESSLEKSAQLCRDRSKNIKNLVNLYYIIFLNDTYQFHMGVVTPTLISRMRKNQI